MNSERIKEIQQGTAYPNSISVQQALLQVWNECEQQERSYSEEEIIPLLNALQYFINRVENGTIKSKTTYKMYKELLEQFKKK